MEPQRPSSSRLGSSSFSFLNLSVPTGGKIKLKGAQTDGYVARSSEPTSKYTPAKSLQKGLEYVAGFKEEEDRKHFESVIARADREDVTGAEPESSQMHQLEELTSVGTVPNVANLSREQSGKVFNFYNVAPVEPENHLKPIHRERNRIVGLIESNPVCVIKGPTGCGKSTQIPQFILDHYAQKKAYCNIVVTQPRRIAAVTIGEHICKQRSWELGHLVGYQVALDKKISEDTRLLYCTTGVLLEKLIADKDLNTFTHILLDEVHEREEDMDFVMLIVKRFQRENSRNVKVILMSATLDVSRFSQYFETVTRYKNIPAPCFSLEPEKQFNVTVYYLEQLSNVSFKLPSRALFDKADPQCFEDLFSLVAFMIESFNRIDDSDFKMKKSAERRSAVLIFLPGLYQIEALHEYLTNENNNPRRINPLNLWLCPLHSSITKDEQERVRKYPEEGKRKVILSTNIAESSITIPDVKYVIDFCLTKHLVADPNTGFSSLQLAWASHTNCIQREGRVGRVQDGRVYRLVPQSFYEYEMDKECVPEMQRCPLEAIVLKCKKLMEDMCPLQLISLSLDPPDLSNYQKTMLKLKEIGALLTTCRGEPNNEDGDLTFIGKVMGSLPLDIHITKLILLGHVFDVLPEAIIMGCAMSVRNIFSEPFKERMQSYNNKLLWANTDESDPIAYLNVYLHWRQMVGSGRFLRSSDGEARWARRYLLQIRHLNEVAKLEEDIKGRLRKFNIEPIADRHKPQWNPNEKGLILKVVLAGAFYPHYFSRKPQSLSAEHDAVKMLSGHSPHTSVLVQGLPEPQIIYVDQLESYLRKHKIGDNMRVHLDGSKKVVIEFDDHVNSQDTASQTLQSRIPGNIKMAVYRAVKLKQLRLPFVINCFLPNEVDDELEKHKRLQRSNPVKVDYKPMIPINHFTIELEVTHVENAGRFYSHIIPSAIQNRDLVYRIVNNPDNLQSFSEKPERNTVCAAKFREGEDKYSYYRGQIRGFSEGMVDIFFIDFGNTEKVLVKDLKKFNKETKEKLDGIAPIAVECVLAEVGPCLWSRERGEWSMEATQYVIKEIYNKTIMAKVYSYVDRVASLYVYSQDNARASNEEPPTLNKKLVKKGYAEYKQESYLSKENHRRRCEIEEQGYNPTAVNDEDSLSVNSLSSDLGSFYMNTKSGFRSKVSLKGPSSPLEMKLFSMTHCSTQRSCNIDWSSVNSVLLDGDPSDPHERLVVAASISQSADGNKLTLNHTTVLPNMPGLAALICLLFCPIAEIRVDSHMSRYTGALCGLGINPEDGQSAFPENDIEIPFDTEFTSDDLLDINKVRFWMNRRLSSFDADDPPDGTVVEIQRNVHAIILDLLKRHRPSVRVTYSLKSHVWGLIHEDWILKPYKDLKNEIDEFKFFVYKLHCGVLVKQDKDRLEIETLYEQLVEMEYLLKNKVAPRELKCHLCDNNFDYMKLLLLHVDSNYHRQLRKWLLSRVVAHKLPRPEVFL